LGESVDLREIPAVIGGDIDKRHGIVLAKSIPAKQFGIVTGEPIVKALQKCPGLFIAKPDFSLYVRRSRAFIELLQRYAPVVEQFSIDEAFCDMTGTEGLYGSLVDFAHKIKDQVREELGFTVNIGVSSNRLLAKIASDFKKPDLVHTLFPEEIKTKLWPLPVGDLLYVGRSTAERLHTLGIRTVGELARTDPAVLTAHLKKQGSFIHDLANGIDPTPVAAEQASPKGYGNSTTLPADLTNGAAAERVLLALCEKVGARIRADRAYVSMVSVTIKDSSFQSHSRQQQLPAPDNTTEQLYSVARKLFYELWDGSPIRLLGVSTGHVTEEDCFQYDLFDSEKREKLSKLNAAVDRIRTRYGDSALKRACFLDSEPDLGPRK
ncbi:MAG: DNA polymerase thumb domain-containing protein, partial [Lachnospiraceae bacterium]